QVVRLDDAVAVVADHMWAAKQGLAALAIRWDDGPNAKVSTADVVRELDGASQQPGVVARTQGDAAAAIAGAAKRIEAVYQVPFLAHAALEPANCTVHVRKDGCEVWTGSQVLARAQATAAEVTGLPLDKVVVHNHLLGRIRAPARGRLRDPSRADRETGRWARESGLDPRGRYPARRLPPVLLRPDCRRPGRARQADRV